MANHKTAVQRRNDRMYKIFDRAKAEGRGLVGNSKQDGHGVNSPAMKKEMAKKMANKELAGKLFSHKPSGKEGEYRTPHHNEYLEMSPQERNEVNTYMGRLHRRKNK